MRVYNMPTFYKNTLLGLLLMITTNVHADESSPPFSAVQRLFSAISAFDYMEMKAVATSDFQLLEVGEVWDMDVLINVLKPAENQFKRRNYFAVIKLVEKDDIAWVSYWNKAVYESTETKTKTWLESAVMINTDNEWKLQMLHSTGVDSASVPESVDFEEYVN